MQGCVCSSPKWQMDLIPEMQFLYACKVGQGSTQAAENMSSVCVCVCRSHLHGGVHVAGTRIHQLLPLPPIAESRTVQEGGKGEKKMFKPSEMRGISKYLSTSHRQYVIY